MTLTYQTKTSKDVIQSQTNVVTLPQIVQGEKRDIMDK